MSLQSQNYCYCCKNQLRKIVKAVTYCQQCKVYFCAECAHSHTKLKKTSSHTFKEIAESDSSKLTDGNTCDYCKTGKGKSFCVSCNSFLCDECIKRHKRVHAPKKTSRDCSTDLKLCNECKRHGYVCVSEKICSGCVRNLCYECCHLHKCKNDTGRKGVAFDIPNCEPCECISIITTAKSVCVDCDEFLCEQCSDLHTATKAFQFHKLALIQNPGKAIKNTLFCEPCKKLAITEPAMFTCSDCDNELFCESCSIQHTTFKQTKHHKMMSTVLHAKFTEEREAQTEKFEQEDKGTETFANEDSLNSSKYTPGKPKPSYIGIDSVTLTWEAAESFDSIGYYQVSYSELGNQGKWIYVQDQELKVPNITVCHLMTNTGYIFRVRLVNKIGEGPYSPVSDRIITRTSSAGMLMSFSKKFQDGSPFPAVYTLPIVENMEARNEKAKTRRFEIGGVSTKLSSSTEKTIMIVGISGCGKSTVVDNMINYILGVQWTDQFRFTTREKQNKDENESNWINIFSIRPEQGSRLQYQLNIIDVPTFDGSKPLAKNFEIVEKVRALLAESAPLGLDYLDAICFIVKSTDSKVTKFQDSIFQYLLASFGKDLEENVFVVLTFSDIKDPPILQSLKETSLPVRKTFDLNTSALFLANVGLNATTTVPHFWDAAKASFEIFFEELSNTKVQNLQKTQLVLKQQLELKKNFDIIQKQVHNVLQKSHEIYEEQEKIIHTEHVIEANESFKTVVERGVPVMNEHPSGSYAVNCSNCKVTCCTSVASPSDDIDKCSAIDTSGRCKVCTQKCLSSSHKIETSVYTLTKEPVTEIDQAKKDAFEKATLEVQRLECRVKIMSSQMEELSDKLHEDSEKITICRQMIDKNSLQPHVGGLKNEIDLSIEMEKEDRKEGFIDRIRRMKEFRAYLEITDNIDQFAEDARSILCVVGRNRPENAEAFSNLRRFSQIFKSLHY